MSEKRIVSSKNAGSMAVVDSPESLILQAMEVLAIDIAQLQKRTLSTSIGLTDKEMERLRQNIKTLISIRADNRAQQKVDKLDELTDEQLKELAKQLLEDSKNEQKR